MAEPERYPAVRTYGRRKGHRLSPRKQRLFDELLPGLRPDLDAPAPHPLTGLFGASVSEVWLEIGFGAGEHLYWQATANPHAGIIGCEPFVNGVAALLGSLADDNPGNIRVWDGDVRDLLPWLADGAISRVFILHPDPWPKLRHRKRRLVSPRTLRELARIMRKGAELRIATDIADYARTSLEAVRMSGSFEWTAQCAADWRERPGDWPQTRYERKALREGRKPLYMKFERL